MYSRVIAKHEENRKISQAVLNAAPRAHFSFSLYLMQLLEN